MPDINLINEVFPPLHLFVRSPRCKSHVETGASKQHHHHDKRKGGGSEIIVHERAALPVKSNNGNGVKHILYKSTLENLEEKLRIIAEEAISRFSIDDILCWARLGAIKIGDPYLRLIVWSKHRAHGIEATDWLLREIQNSNIIVNNTLGEIS